jgi:hypothetical protein
MYSSSSNTQNKLFLALASRMKRPYLLITIDALKLLVVDNS